MRPDWFEAYRYGEPLHTEEHRLLARLLYTRCMQTYANSGLATFASIGFPAVTLTGTASAHDDARVPFVDFASSTLNADCGLIGGAATQVRSSSIPLFRAIVKTGATIATSRIWCALAGASPMGNAGSATVSGMGAGTNLMGFRYDSAVDATLYFRCFTRDGTANTEALTTLTSAVQSDVGKVVINTVYELEIVSFGYPGTNMYKLVFYINRRPVAIHTASLPVGAAWNMGVYAAHRNLAATAHSFRVSQLDLYTNPLV